MSDDTITAPPSLSSITSSDAWKGIDSERQGRILDKWKNDAITYGRAKVPGFDDSHAKQVEDHIATLKRTSAPFPYAKDINLFDVFMPDPSTDAQKNEQIKKLGQSIISESEKDPNSFAARVRSNAGQIENPPFSNPNEPVIKLPEPSKETAAKHPYLAGATAASSEFLSGLTTPNNIKLMVGLASSPDAIQRLAEVGFTAEGAKGIYDSVKQIPNEQDPSKRTKLITSAILNAGMVAMMAKHATIKDAVTPEQRANAEAELNQFIDERKAKIAAAQAEVDGLPETAKAIQEKANEPPPAPPTESTPAQKDETPARAPNADELAAGQGQPAAGTASEAGGDQTGATATGGTVEKPAQQPAQTPVSAEPIDTDISEGDRILKELENNPNFPRYAVFDKDGEPAGAFRDIADAKKALEKFPGGTLKDNLEGMQRTFSEAPKPVETEPSKPSVPQTVDDAIKKHGSIEEAHGKLQEQIDNPATPEADREHLRSAQKRMENIMEDEHRREMSAQHEEEMSGRHELIQSVKKLGGLPTDPKKQIGLSGELDRVRQAKKGAAQALFRKSAKHLDQLRQSLNERGFNFETPGEMIDAIETSLISGKKITGAERGISDGPGAAHSAEFPPQKTTGLKKAVVKDERMQRALEDLPAEERQSEEKRVQSAEDRISSDPNEAPKLISSIVDDGKVAISADDAATLLVERNRVMNESRALESEWFDPETSKARKAEVTKKLEDAEKQLDRLDRAQRAAGSSWGRTGKMYQRLIREDYTLEAIQRRRRMAKNAPLTPEERQTLKEQSEQIAALQKKVEEGQATKAELEQAQQLTRVHEATIAELKAQPKHAPEVLRTARNIVTKWRAEADAVKNDIFTLLTRSNESGAIGDLSKGGAKKSFSDANKIKTDLINKLALEIRATIGEYGLSAAERGTELNRIIIEKFGDGIAKFIDKAKEVAFKLINKEEKSSEVKKSIKTGTKKAEKTPVEIKARAKAEATAGEELSHKTVYDLARAHINAGVHGEDAVMKAVHDDLKDIFPDATERDIRRAFSEYGNSKFPSREADKMELAELRNLTRLQESIDRLKEGQDALKTGLQRDKASRAIREKQKQLNELLKARQGPPSTERLATNMEARQTALRNQIEDLDKQLQTGEKPPGRTPPSPLDAEGERLTAERDAMKAKLKEIEDAEHPGKTPEERYNEQRQKAIAKQTADIQERLRTGNYAKPLRPLPPEKTAETVKAYSQLQKLKQQLREADEKAKVENRTPSQKLIDTVITKPYHFLTAVKITGHGTVGMVTHAGGLIWRPSKAVIYWRNFGRQFPMWIKPEYHDRLIYNLENDPEFNSWKDAGAAIDPQKTYTDYGLYAKWIPKSLLNLGKSGQRGFDALKLTRLELNKSDWKNVSPEIKADPRAALEARKLIAEINNKATGVLKGNEPLAQLARNKYAQAAFFAPKLYASRWTRVLLDPIKTTSTFLDWNRATTAEKTAATMKLKHAGEFAATYVAALVTNQAILSATGSNQKINFTDPTKSDWLKFKAGGKEIMADGGLLDPLRLIGQIVWGDLIRNRTSNEQYRDGTRFDKVGHDIWKYLRGKANPSFGLIIDASTRSDFQGRPLPFSNEKPRFKDQPKYKWGEWIAEQGPIPLSGGIKVAYDAMREKGLSDVQARDIIQGAAVAATGMTGVHVTADYMSKKKGR